MGTKTRKAFAVDAVEQSTRRHVQRKYGCWELLATACNTWPNQKTQSDQPFQTMQRCFKCAVQIAPHLTALSTNQSRTWSWKRKSEELSAQHGTKVLEAFGKFWKRSAEPRTCADDTDLSDGASYTVIRYYFDVVKQKISGSLTKVLGNW